MNVSLPSVPQNPFTAQGVGIPAPDCQGGTAYIDDNTGMWDCTAPPPQTSSHQSGGLTVFILAAAVAGYLYWKFGSDAQKKVGEMLS